MDNDSKLRLLYIEKMLQETDEAHSLTNSEIKRLLEEKYGMTTHRTAGMTDDAIQQMYEFDLAVFRRRRVDAMHEQSFAIFEHKSDVDNSETNNPLYKHHIGAFSTMDDYTRQGDRFSWIEQISNIALYKRLSLLSDDDKELLALFTQEGLSKREIAKIRNVTEQSVGQKIKRLKQFLSFC